MKHLSPALWRTTVPPLLWALLATALPTLSWAQAPEEEARQGLDCESYSQAGMRECLDQHAQRSSKRLQQAQTQVRTTLHERLRDNTRLRSAAQAKLDAARPYATFKSPAWAARPAMPTRSLACVV